MTFSIHAGPAGKTYDSMTEMLEDAKKAGIHITADGEDISDLVPKPESHSVIWARFNGKSKKPAGDDAK